MDYKEKYEQAMLRMNKWVEGSEIIEPKEVAEFIFPELKESEDEKIRKELIEKVKETPACIGFNDKKAVLSWFEKQGEQIDIANKEYWRGYREGKQETIDKYSDIEKQGEQKSAAKIQLGKKYKCIASPIYSIFREGEIYKPKDKFLCSLMNVCYSCFEQIEDGEQKPVECIKLDNEFENQISHLIASVLNSEHEYNEGFVKYVSQSLLGFAKKEQKPAEWSEDDSRKTGTLSSIIFDYAFYKDALDENNDLTGDYAELNDWLATLPERFNLQPKQEWSDEDKENYRTMLKIIQNSNTSA